MKIFPLLALTVSLAFSSHVYAKGAIAIDDQVGEDEPAYGVSTGEDTPESAKASAVKYCKEYGGTNCRAVVWFETCGAVAVTKKYFGYGYGKTKGVATAKALEMCGRNECKIVATECE